MSRTARPERGHPDLAGREAHPQRTPSAPPVLAAGNQAVARMLARFGVSEAVGGLVSGVETLTQMATGAIGGSVGHKGKNDPVDVAIVRGLLNAAGFDDPETGAAIERYQREKLGWPSADGRVDPGGKTLRALHGEHGAPASGGATPAPSTAAEPAPTPAPSPAPAPAPTGGDGGVLSWPGLLPQVKRDAKHAITVKKGKLELNVPAVDTPALTDDQKAIVDQIRANREALPSLLSDKNMGKRGYSYHDSMPQSETATPSELQGNTSSPELRAKKFAWEEIRTEGGLDSINTYDDQIVTWGKGFSARASMIEVMHTLFKSDPEAETMLLRAGIALHGNTWMVVNGETGAVETGDNGLRLLQFDRKLLSIFITLGSDPKHAGHSLDAQYAALSKHALKVPKYALDWPEDSIRLMAHFSHWLPAYGWGNQNYAATGGDLLKIIAKYARFLAHKQGSGAEVVPANWEFVTPGHRLYAFARGAGIAAVKQGAAEVTLTKQQLDTDKQLDGHLLIPISGDRYYDLGT